MLKKIFLLVFSVLFVQISLADSSLPMPSHSTESLNGVVAVVNSEVITQSDLNQAIFQAKQQLSAQANPNAISNRKIRQMALQQLIDEKLQLELAQRGDVTVTNAEVMQAINHIAAGNHMALADLKSKLLQEGMTFKAYEKLIHKQLLMRKVQQQAVAGEVTVTAADIQQARQMAQSQMSMQQSFHVIDILADSKKQAEKYLAELNSGADITKIAPGQVNDLGWRAPSQLPEIFVQQLSNMKPGDVAGPILAPNGYHVIKLVNARGSMQQYTQTQLKNIAYEIQFHKAVQKWMEKIRKTAYIKITGE